MSDLIFSSHNATRLQGRSVSPSAPADTNVLAWDLATLQWKPTAAGGGGGAPTNATYITLSTNATLTDERVLTGTANQITITDGGAGTTATLSLPQSIATTSAVQFGSATLGTAASATGNLLFNGLTSGTITIKSADAAGTYTLTLPTTDGAASEFLQTDGAGVLTWATPADVGANTALSNLAAVAINTSLISDTDVTDDLGSMAIRWNGIFGASLNTGDTAADTLLLRAYDVDGAAYTTFATLTANNTPTMDLAAAVTLGSNTIATTNLKLSSFAATTSAELAGVISDETGTGLLVFGTAPTFASTVNIGTAGGTTGAITLNGTTSGTVTLKVADAAGTYTLTLPLDDGTASQFLQTDGAGALTWASAAAAGANTALSNLAAVAVNTTLVSDTDVTDDLGSMAIRWNGVFAASLNTGDTAADTLLLRAYDVDGAAYTTFATLTANNTPTMDLAAAVTLGTNPIATTNLKLSSFAATTSAELAGVISDETGTGLLVFGTAPTLASTVTIGTAGGTTGAINLKGTTSGTVTLTTAAAAGTYTLTLPTTDGAASEFLQTDGAGVLTWAAGSGFAWGATAAGTTGTGAALTISNSAASGVIGLSVTQGNTQSSYDKRGIQVDMGTAGAFNNANYCFYALQKSGASLTYGYVADMATTATNATGLYVRCKGTTLQTIQLLGSEGSGVLVQMGSNNDNTAFGAIVGNNSNNQIICGSTNANNAYALFALTDGGHTASPSNMRMTYIRDLQTGVSSARTNTANEYASSRSHTTGTRTDNWHMFSFTRTEISNHASATITSQGTVVNLVNVVTQTLGTITDSTAVLKLTQATLSSGTGIDLTFPGTGKMLAFDGTVSSATLAARTTDVNTIALSRTNTATSGTVADDFNLAYLTRTAIQNGAGGTLTSAGSVLKLENVATQTAGTLTDSVDVLRITQDADSTGYPISITQNAVVTTNFKKIMSLAGVTLWVSNATDPNGTLAGTAGDVCFNGLTNKIQYCTGTTVWV